MPQAYGMTGAIQVAPIAIKGSGAPSSNFKAELGQQYFDTSTSPANMYVFNGNTWSKVEESGGSDTFSDITVSGLATLGSITTSGNVTMSGAGTKLTLEGGAVTDFIGTGTLASGTLTIANTNIAAADRIFIQRIDANGSTTLGELSYTISAGASFTVNSLILGTPGSVQTGDTSTFSYFIVRQA